MLLINLNLCAFDFDVAWFYWLFDCVTSLDIDRYIQVM